MGFEVNRAMPGRMIVNFLGIRRTHDHVPPVERGGKD